VKEKIIGLDLTVNLSHTVSPQPILTALVVCGTTCATEPGWRGRYRLRKGYLQRSLQRGMYDSKRIYAAGYSMGGGMAYASACRAADLFAAVVLCSFDFYDDPQCNPSRQISVLSFRGKSDPLALYDGSVGPPGHFIGGKRTLEALVKINHCSGAPVNIGPDTRCTRSAMLA
jgi:hypothetical protein